MSDFLNSTESVTHESRRRIATVHAGRALVVFHVSNRFAALYREDLERITPMAELACPPGLPPVLQGILNLGGAAIPVLRLDHLFGLPPQRVGLYSMLVILRTPGEARIAVLVDRVSEVVIVPDNEILSTSQEDSFNGCAEAVVVIRDEIVHILSLNRMFLAKEREALSQFQAMAQRRLEDWETSRA